MFIKEWKVSPSVVIGQINIFHYYGKTSLVPTSWINTFSLGFLHPTLTQKCQSLVPSSSSLCTLSSLVVLLHVTHSQWHTNVTLFQLFLFLSFSLQGCVPPIQTQRNNVLSQAPDGRPHNPEGFYQAASLGATTGPEPQVAVGVVLDHSSLFHDNTRNNSLHYQTKDSVLCKSLL